ncbi:MAG: hypothetical protein RID91_14475 [Azospirillaceae bacterium]
MADRSDTLLAATRKGLFTLRADAGRSWAAAGPPAFLGEPVSALLSDPRDGTLYAALRLGHFGVKLHRSRDGGVSWEEVAAPSFPAEADGPEDATSVDMIWTLEAGDPDTPGHLWAGTLPAALFESRDHGENWRRVDALWRVPERAEWFGGGYDDAGLHSILVDPRDPARLTVAISCGGVWKSDDAGASWRLVGQGLRNDYLPPDRAYDPGPQDPHRLAHCAAAPNVVWCQHHNGVFRSEDGGETFEEIRDIRPSVFGFAVAAHPHDPATAWFVPAVKDACRVPVDGRLVVTRTSDGGRAFEAFGEGLPAAGCYDLVYRHALAVDTTGDRLAMGSTTGSLWTSADGGQRWAAVTAHLPPIAQVAFA